MTIILFQITFRQTSLSLNRSFCKRPENIDVSEVHDKTRKEWPCHVRHVQGIYRPRVPAFLLRKLAIYKVRGLEGRSPGYQRTLSKEVFERRTSTGSEAFSHLTCLNASYLNCTAKCSLSCKEDLPIDWAKPPGGGDSTYERGWDARRKF